MNNNFGLHIFCKRMCNANRLKFKKGQDFNVKDEFIIFADGHGEDFPPAPQWDVLTI